MLRQGDLFPHISVRCIDGTTFHYDDIWQRRNLLLVALAGEGVDRQSDEADYSAGVSAHEQTLQDYETTVVLTREPVAGLPAPATLIADRWGEIVAIDVACDTASLPPVSTLLEQVRAVAHACPECEGEAR